MQGDWPCSQGSFWKLQMDRQQFFLPNGTCCLICTGATGCHKIAWICMTCCHTDPRWGYLSPQILFQVFPWVPVCFPGMQPNWELSDQQRFFLSFSDEQHNTQDYLRPAVCTSDHQCPSLPFQVPVWEFSGLRQVWKSLYTVPMRERISSSNVSLGSPDRVADVSWPSRRSYCWAVSFHKATKAGEFCKCPWQAVSTTNYYSTHFVGYQTPQ